MKAAARVLPVSKQLWHRGESRRRLLDAALEAMAASGPGGVSGRSIAAAADVHHAQIQQMFGSVEALLNASLLNERDRYLAEMFTAPGAIPDPFAPIDYPFLWRAISQVVLDPGHIDMAPLAAGGPAQRIEVELASTVENPIERLAIASAWVALPLGFMVFEDTFCRGLELSTHDMSHCMNRIRYRLGELTSGEADLETGSESPPAHAAEHRSPPTDASNQLVSAAQELLATRLETSVRGRELAEHAGVNYGLISHYFGSKAAVFDKALTELHSQLVEDAVRDDANGPRLAGPDLFTRHRTFIRAWASRLIGDRPITQFELVGMRAVISHTHERRRQSADRLDVIGDSLAAFSLGLGWAILGPLPTAGDGLNREAITDQMYRLHYWLLDG